MVLNKRRRHLKAASDAALASKRRRKAEELSRQLLPSPPLPPESLSIDNSDTDPCGSDSESEFSDQELKDQDHWDDENGIGYTLPEPLPNAFAHLRYKEGADSKLRGLYGKGSLATTKRKAREQRERSEIASKCYSIVDMFKKPPSERSRTTNPGTANSLAESRKDAQSEIEDLLRLKTKMTEKFGPDGLQGATRRRYELVRSFFWAEQQSPNLTRKEIALRVANSFNRGEHTARKILIWEKQWVMNREIEPTKHSSSAHSVSILDDEGALLAAREYISGAGDSK